MTKLPWIRIGARAGAGRGYTIVELMMAIAVFAIGVSGIIAMQKVAAAANQHSRALSLATNIAQAWQDQLNADSSLFTNTTTNPLALNNTAWLSQLVSNTGSVSNQTPWFKPTWNANLGIGAPFDALGKPIDDTNGQGTGAQFCVHLRLTRLYPNSPGIEVIRTEVRVIWPRTEATTSSTFCDSNTLPSVLAADINDYHFLYQVSAVRQQP